MLYSLKSLVNNATDPRGSKSFRNVLLVIEFGVSGSDDRHFLFRADCPGNVMQLHGQIGCIPSRLHHLQPLACSSLCLKQFVEHLNEKIANLQITTFTFIPYFQME